jgi:hypothetical protein
MNVINRCAILCLFTASAVGQTCVNYIEDETPNSRFAEEYAGTVTDKETQLMWMRCSLGQAWNVNSCVGSISYFNWKAALEEAELTTFAGFNDWRLPNVKELESITEGACTDPSVNTSVFPGVQSSPYWTSTPVVKTGAQSWQIEFSSGVWTTTEKSNTRFAILVRDKVQN